MKNLYMYRSQFPLILAFAVTIHKCQGLSLDNAIIDFSDKVLNAGTAYVALSRVRTLSGLSLTSFDPKALMVSRCSIEEINRLRKIYRPDLPQYAIQKIVALENVNLLAHMIYTMYVDEPQTKKQKCLNPLTAVSSKRPLLDSKNVMKDFSNSSKKPRIDNGGGNNNNNNNVDDDVEEIGFNPWGTVSHNYKYHPPNADTRKSWCRSLNLRYVKTCRLCLGSTNTALTVPSRDIDVPGDGNCLFNALSRVITGSIEQQSDVRAAIVNHMPNIEGHLARGWFPRIYQTEGNILLEKLLIRHCHVAIST